MITIYTDGSCRGNPGPGGWGAVVLEDDNIIDVAQEKAAQTTNNRMELSAILWAMEKYGSSRDIPIVYSDSAYCVNSLTNWIYKWQTNGWRKANNQEIENLDFMQRYLELESNGKRIDLRKCRGHAGQTWNEMADGLATGRLKMEDIKI